MTETKFDPHTEQLKAKDEMIAYYKEKIEDLEMDRDSLKRMNDDMQEVLDKIVEVSQEMQEELFLYSPATIEVFANKILNIIKLQKEVQKEQS